MMTERHKDSMFLKTFPSVSAKSPLSIYSEAGEPLLLFLIKISALGGQKNITP